jgi:hypothetical protein
MDEVPIVPVYFYAGFTLFDGARIQGIYPNVLDEHPIQDIRKAKAAWEMGRPNTQKRKKAEIRAPCTS